MDKIEKLYPACKHPIWGGERLTNEYGKGDGKERLGETWELSFHPDGLSTLRDGRTLRDAAGPDELGRNAAAFSDFPVLIKLIDAAADLSVQVHPTDAYARKKERDQGKTEMWIIVDEAPGAFVSVGFRRDVTDNEIREAIRDHTIPKLLNHFDVTSGEVYFVPAGTVHAIGRGCLILEIQESSNLTYRLYDYGRKGPDGRERELHVEKALAVMDRKKYPLRRKTVFTESGEWLGGSRYFTVYRRIIEDHDVIKTDENSFRCVICVAGSGTIGAKPVRSGDTFFLKAGRDKTPIDGSMTLILVAVRRYLLRLSRSSVILSDDIGQTLLEEKLTENEEAEPRSLVEKALSLLHSLSLTAEDLSETVWEDGFDEGFRHSFETALGLSE